MTASSHPKHDFVVRTAGVSVMDDDVFDALFEAGCDDALVGTSADGDFLDLGGVVSGSTDDDVVTAQSVNGVVTVRAMPGQCRRFRSIGSGRHDVVRVSCSIGTALATSSLLR